MGETSYLLTVGSSLDVCVPFVTDCHLFFHLANHLWPQPVLSGGSCGSRTILNTRIQELAFSLRPTGPRTTEHPQKLAERGDPGLSTTEASAGCV